MNLYEFTFIGQQMLSHQEVEGMAQEFALLLHNIRKELVSQNIRNLVDNIAKDSNSIEPIDHEFQSCIAEIQEKLLVYFDVLEKSMKILWVDLQADFSNLKEIKSQITAELPKNYEAIASIIKLLSIKYEQPKKDKIVHKVANVLKEHTLICVKKIFQDTIKGTGIKFNNQKFLYKLDRAVEKFIKDVEASGIIKLEHWGLLDFAYPIDKVKSGHYCFLCISSTPRIMDEFKRRVKLNENVVRYLCIRVDKVFEGKSQMLNASVEE